MYSIAAQDYVRAPVTSKPVPDVLRRAMPELQRGVRLRLMDTHSAGTEIRKWIGLEAVHVSFGDRGGDHAAAGRIRGNGFGFGMSRHRIGTRRNAARDRTFPHIPEEQVIDLADTTDGLDQKTLSQGVSTSTAARQGVVDPLIVTKRLQRDGRWPEVQPVLDRLMKECRKKGMSKTDAQTRTYAELDRLFPPLEPEPTADSDSDSQFGAADGGFVTGLSDIPES